MKKIIYISPEGVISPYLFQTFNGVFSGSGYMETNAIEVADLVFYDLYSYQRPMTIPQDKPIVFFDFSDYGGMSKEKFVPEFFGNYQKKIVFIRKMDKMIDYPRWCYPIECIQYPDHDFEPVSKEELFEREFDICWIGNESPQRKNVVNGLLNAGFKMDVHWTNENGKIPHEEWLDRHRNAKFFLTSDGGGFSDERIYQLGTIAAILKQSNNHLQHRPFTATGADCLEVFEKVPDFDIWYIKQVINDKEKLYRIYMNGINHLHEYYSAKYRSKYILNILKQNNL